MKNVADVYHLTPVQRDVLASQSARVVQVRWQVRGELDSAGFEQSWQRLLARHAMLRTCFLTEQLREPVQVVRQQAKLAYERYDLREVEASRQHAELEDLLRMDRQRVFDAVRAPLFRVMEIRLGAHDCELVLSHHPVLLDRRSVRLLIDEVVGSDRVGEAALYKNYVAWVERQDVKGAELWLAHYQNGDRRPASDGFELQEVGVDESCVSVDADELVMSFAKRCGASVEAVVTGAWALALMRERGVNAVTIGVFADERPKALAGSEEIVGLMESVLPLTLEFSGEDSVPSWLRDVEEKIAKLQRYAHVSMNPPISASTIRVNPRSNSLTQAGLTLTEHVDPTPTDVINKLHDALSSLTFPSLQTQTASAPPPNHAPLDFSLFYFADDNAIYGEDKYRLYREGALFADRHQLTAVWTPERHFHEKAGLYPNPSVLSASLATITKHVKLRAGSVVLPLHNSLRVAEEWSVVDNLSNGRTGVSFTSGWMPNDFAFFPERYPTKRDEMFRGIEEVQRLWRGEAIAARDGLGKEIDVRIFPKPISPELPIWLTCSGGPEMFEKAGELGFHVLTALLTQSIEEVAPKIQLYRDSLARHGHDPRSRQVTMMMHTFIGEDPEAVLQQVRVPLTKYLKSHLNLIETGAQSLNLEVNIREHEDPEKYREQMAAFAFERYYRTSSLIGTPSSCLKMIERLQSIGVDEVACLIDFGVEVDAVLESLEHLVVLRELSAQMQPEENLLVSTAAQV